jgi:hypothetical protein
MVRGTANHLFILLQNCSYLVWPALERQEPLRPAELDHLAGTGEPISAKPPGAKQSLAQGAVAKRRDAPPTACTPG